MKRDKSSVERSLSGEVLAFDIREQVQIVRGELVGGRVRIARTLVKEGPFRSTAGAFFLLTLSTLESKQIPDL